MGEDTFYITSLRDPTSRYESDYGFIQLEEFFGMTFPEYVGKYESKFLNHAASSAHETPGFLKLA